MSVFVSACSRACVCALLCTRSALPSGSVGSGITVACAVCASALNVSGAEDRHPEAMGVYLPTYQNRVSISFGSRSIYLGGDDTMWFLYYWPAWRRWLIGRDPYSSLAVVASATLEATCPDDVSRWLVCTLAGCVSTYPVAVVPALLRAGQTFSPTQLTNAASVGNTPVCLGSGVRGSGSIFYVLASPPPSFAWIVACFLRPPAGALTDSVSMGPPRPRPHLDLQLSFAGTLVSCAGDVPSITIGSWRWSCAIDCLGSTCGLSPDVGAVYSLNGTLPDAIGSLSCRSKIKIMYETTPSERAGLQAPL
jgi:hypothetical protein